MRNYGLKVRIHLLLTFYITFCHHKLYLNSLLHCGIDAAPSVNLAAILVCDPERLKFNQGGVWSLYFWNGVDVSNSRSYSVVFRPLSFQLSSKPSSEGILNIPNTDFPQLSWKKTFESLTANGPPSNHVFSMPKHQERICIN